MTDSEYMRLALSEARAALEANEVPVGAIVVRDGTVIAAAHNRVERDSDATAHAELIALREAIKKTGCKWLHGCTLYVTLEPCAMCAGAMVNARIDRLVFGAYDERQGCAISVMDIPDAPLFHRMRCTGGIMESECAALLVDCFEKKRC